MNLNELVEDLGINFNKVAAISDKIATRASPEAYIKYVSFQEKTPGGTQPRSIFRSIDYQPVIKRSVETQPKKKPTFPRYYYKNI